MLTGNRTATVSGTAVDLVTHNPLSGLECRDLRNWQEGGSGATTNAAGRFDLEIEAEIRVILYCFGRRTGVGQAPVSLMGGTKGNVLVEVVMVPWPPYGGTVGFFVGGRPPATVTEVDSAGPGKQAGVMVGDRVQRVNGVDVSSFASWQVSLLIGDHPVGEKVPLVLRRDGRDVNVSVVVIEPRGLVE